MLVSTRSLSKIYGVVAALSRCTFDIPAGQICGLLGPNGSGKTTLLRLLMGYLSPTAGTATIDGLDCHKKSVEVHRRVSYLPGEVRLPRRMRGRDVLRFFSEVRPDGNLERALHLAEQLQLDLSRQVARSSTGMRQMMAVATTLSVDAPLWILDEPTANLDPSVRSHILGWIRQAKEAGRTVIFSSHVLSEVEQVCDRVIMLRRGSLVHDQVMADLRRQHRVHARLREPMPNLPEELADDVSVLGQGNGQITLETPGELTPLLGWLATLPVAELQIERVGLETVYERFHSDTMNQA